MKTGKRYYTDMLASSLRASVVRMDKENGYVYLDQTIAYPEGGGQPSDHGRIVFDGQEVMYDHASKEGGSVLLNDDFPSIKVNTDIRHHIVKDDLEKLSRLNEGDSVVINIDVERRERLSLSHTASHVLYMAIDQLRPGLPSHIIGCSIRLDSARFDILTDERFDADELQGIETLCNDFIQADLPVQLYPLDGFDEAWYWECNGFVIPCGGTHIQTTGRIGEVTVSRKNIGKNKERISIAFSEPRLATDRYAGISNES